MHDGMVRASECNGIGAGFAFGTVLTLLGAGSADISMVCLHRRSIESIDPSHHPPSHHTFTENHHVHVK